MSRPRKRRRVCGLPRNKSFGPLNREENKKNEVIRITVEEHEIVRLIDLEGLDQTQCAEKMGVARSTIQRAYIEVKEKIADCIVNGKVLRIEGGDYELCEKNVECEPCYRGRMRRGRNK